MTFRPCALAGAFALALTLGAATARDKPESIRDLMETAHGEDGLKDQVAKANKEKKLGDARKPMEDWARLAGMLGKFAPPKGFEADWKKLTAEYEKQVKDLAAAVKDEKPDDVTAALKAVNKSCTSCHARPPRRRPKDNDKR